MFQQRVSSNHANAVIWTTRRTFSIIIADDAGSGPDSFRGNGMIVCKEQEPMVIPSLRIVYYDIFSVQMQSFSWTFATCAMPILFLQVIYRRTVSLAHTMYPIIQCIMI